MNPTTVEQPVVYRERMSSWQTPRGHTARFVYREETNDWNTITSTLPSDEYGLADLRLEGLALDIGAYLGTVAIALAIDNPGLRVIAVEAIGENAELARQNVDLNDLTERVTVLHRAADALGVRSAIIQWRAQGGENERHHAFVGNSTIVPWTQPHQSERIACVSLAGLLGKEEASFVKIDCEGCEWGTLSDPAISRVQRIHGEWHPTEGHVRGDILALLSPTHEVTFSGPVAGPGGFVAVRR